MKLLLLAPAMVLLSAGGGQCNKKQKANAGGPLKAKFEVQAICSNYTFTVTGGTIDPSLVEASWTDETTGKSYKQAFGIANPCDFPQGIKAGDEFYFTIEKEKKTDCAVCMAYYPTPPKKLYIKVVPNP
ncbi:MAG: hypothetical protein EOO09_20180 [Chitinophagaceae bacterium]|nr:MAG: hypothetical protein EOO09_20180 [Chitinophagaceae bacterium]